MNAEERELMLHPLVPENMLYNSKVVSDIRSLTASIFGIAAGILGLESYIGFIFYGVGTTFVSLLLLIFLCGGKPDQYFRNSRDVLTSDVVGGLSSFVLTWTLFYGIVRV